MRQLNLIDKIITHLDHALTLHAKKAPFAKRENPAKAYGEAKLSPSEIKHVAGLMRINHAGEISAQALYQGQALTAHLPHVRAQMETAALEEMDHLAWCKERLEELGSHSSRLDPLWYAGAFMIGALAGLAGDQWSLGFIAETEKQVSTHLQQHLEKLPEQDKKSARILEQMKSDEEQHAENALAAGAAELPVFIKCLMHCSSRLMIKTAYYW